MAKGQMRSNKEAKKPKAAKPSTAPVDNPLAPKTNVKFGKRGLTSPKR